MRLSIGIKIGSSLFLILLVYAFSSFVMLSGILGLRGSMDESLDKSEQMNMLYRYNNLTTRVMLASKNLMLDPRLIQSDQFNSNFSDLKKEIETLMNSFLDIQKTAEDRNASIRIFGGSSKLMELIDASLIGPLKKGENVNLKMVSDAISDRSSVLDDIDKRITALEQERESIVSDARNLEENVVRKGIVFTIIATVLVFIISYFLIRLIVWPVRNATAMLRTISEGEGDLTGKLTVNSRDEIGDLARYFNEFLGRLRSIIENIQTNAGGNIEQEKELRYSGERTAESVARISESLDSIRKQIEGLSKTISDSTTTVRHMSSSIGSLNNQASEQSAMAEESSAAVTEIIASVDNVASITQKKKEAAGILVKNAGKGLEILEETVQAVEDIYENIDSISALTGIISGIASQTNLLSMNAAIEAAHAGDSGKGFAVVADEIRKLAETTGENSREIANVLQVVIERIQTAVEKSGSTQKAFEEINREIGDVIQALDEINSSTYELKSGGSEVLEAMTVLRESSALVKKSVADLNSDSDNVEKLMESVKELYGFVEGEIEGISNGVTDIIANVDSVRSVSDKMGLSATAMADDVNKFKT